MPDILSMQAALERVDLPHTQSYLNDLFRQYDVDKDGSVDFSEFQQYVGHRERAFRKAFRCALFLPYSSIIDALK